MNAETPIAIPWKVRWRYWRHSLLPVVCFIGSAIFVVWFSVFKNMFFALLLFGKQ